MNPYYPKDGPGIYSALLKIRNRRRRLWRLIPVIFSGWLLVGLGIMAGHRGASESFCSILAVTGSVCFVGGTILLFVTGFAVSLSRCPRCGRFFFATLFVGWIFSKKCLHCDQPLYVHYDAGEVEQQRIREWLRRSEPRGPIPDVGLRCPKCAYILTGLTETECPECGCRFSVEKLIETPK